MLRASPAAITRMRSQSRIVSSRCATTSKVASLNLSARSCGHEPAPQRPGRSPEGFAAPLWEFPAASAAPRFELCKTALSPRARRCVACSAAWNPALPSGGPLCLTTLLRCQAILGGARQLYFVPKHRSKPLVKQVARSCPCLDRGLAPRDRPPRSVRWMRASVAKSTLAVA